MHTLERERNEALAARDAAVAERDRALKERDLAINEQEEAAAAAFLGHYPTWRTNRLRFLMDVWRDRLIEGRHRPRAGCGHGDIGAFFLSLGAEVTFSDAREEHLAVVRSRYPGAMTVLHDSNRPVPQPASGRYDFLIHWGCSTTCTPRLSPAASGMRARPRVTSCSKPKSATRPTLRLSSRLASPVRSGVRRYWRPPLQRIHRDRAEWLRLRWQRHDDAGLNTDFHRYDWQSQNDGRFHPDAARRDPLALQQALRRFYTIEAA